MLLWATEKKFSDTERIQNTLSYFHFDIYIPKTSITPELILGQVST